MTNSDKIPDGIYSQAEADAQRPIIKDGYSAYPDHILKFVVSANREKWAAYPNPHPIKTEQLLVADVAAEILRERGVA